MPHPEDQTPNQDDCDNSDRDNVSRQEPRAIANAIEPALWDVLETNHQWLLKKIVPLLIKEGFDIDDAHDGFQAACVELWRNPLLWRGDVPTAKRVLPFVLNRARWRTHDARRHRRRGGRETVVEDVRTFENAPETYRFVGGAERPAEPGELLDLEPGSPCRGRPLGGQAQDPSYRIARDTVVHFFPSARACAIDRRWWQGDPYRKIAKDLGMNYTTLHRHVDFCSQRYDLLGPPDAPTYDVKVAKRLASKGRTLVVALGDEVDRDDRLVKRLPCSDRNNQALAWICEVLPPARKGGPDG